MKNKLISMTIIKNEEGRFLDEFLENIIGWSDHCVIVDDASTDNTPKIIQDFMEKNKHPYTLKVLSESLFKEDELQLRTILWEETRKIANDGDTCIVIDSDELMCPEIHQMKEMLIGIQNVDVIGFKKIEMWNDTHYRVDKLWSNYFGRGFKYKNEGFGFKGKGLHLPCLPAYAFYGKVQWNSGIRVKHLAYQTEEMRKKKYEFAIPNCNKVDTINYPQLLSIIDKEPVLKEYKDKVVVPSIRITMSLQKHYDVFYILEKFKRIMYDPKKISISFSCYACHPQVFEQIKNFNGFLNKDVFVNLQNFQYDFYHTTINNILAETIEACKNNDAEYQFILNSGANMDASLLMDQIQTDRDIVFYINGANVVGLFIKTEVLRTLPADLFTSGNKFDFNKVVQYYKNEKHEYVFYTGIGVPAPFYSS